MDDLVRFLTACLDEDERIARAAADGGSGQWTQRDPENEPGRIETDRLYPVTYDEGHPDEAEAAHIVRHDPARVLREIDAKRQLVERYERAMENRRAHPDDLASAGALLALHGAVKLLALPYADREGYAEAIASFE